MGDFALIWDGSSADMGLEDDDVAEDNGLRTAVLKSLFLDRRAEEGDVIPDGTDNRRGNWADEFNPDPDDLEGSRLWLLERVKVTPAIQPRAELYGREALAWMVSDGVVEKVGFATEIVDGALFYLVTLERPEGDPVKFRFAHVWDGEAARDAPVDTTFHRAIEAGGIRITEAGEIRVTQEG